MVTHSSDVYRAVADPTRRAILDLLKTGKRPVGEIAGEFSVSRPAISKHLRVLREARVVVEERDGRNRIYALDARPLRELDSWLEGYRGLLRKSLSRLKAHVESRK